MSGMRKLTCVSVLILALGSLDLQSAVARTTALGECPEGGMGEQSCGIGNGPSYCEITCREPQFACCGRSAEVSCECLYGY
jgi:hypothetical protein